jgi:hypothetical protein
MKRSIVFILIFFLVFFIQLVSASTRCRHYIDGVCQSGGIIEEVVSSEEKLPVTYPTPQPELPKFVILLFQSIGIIVLFALLIMMIQELIKSKKPKKRK